MPPASTRCYAASTVKTLKFTAKKTQTQKKPGSKVTTQTRVVQPNSWSTCQWMGQAYEWIAQAQRDMRASRSNRHRAWEQRCLGAINRSTLTDWMSTQQQTRKLGDRPSAWAAIVTSRVNSIADTLILARIVCKNFNTKIQLTRHGNCGKCTYTT